MFNVGLDGICLLKEVDILLMYWLFWLINIVKEFKKGWGCFLSCNNIEIVDDIERIYWFRNYVCYKDVLEIEIIEFNDLVFDFMGVIYFWKLLRWKRVFKIVYVL